MKTSYYARPNIHLETNLVSISCSLSTWIKETFIGKNFKHYRKLAPDYFTMVLPYKCGEIDIAEYTTRYQQILDKLDPHEVYKELGEDATLLCYEKPDDFCHRHLVAKWLREAGYDIQEYEYIKPVPPAVADEWIF